jgi:hypothetical protein
MYPLLKILVLVWLCICLPIIATLQYFRTFALFLLANLLEFEINFTFI